MYGHPNGDPNRGLGKLEIAQQVRVPTILADDLGLVPSTKSGGSQPVPEDPTSPSDLHRQIDTSGAHKSRQAHIHTCINHVLYTHE